MQLMQMGVVTDPLYLLEHIELPGKEKLIRSIAEQQKAAAGGDPMSPEEMEGMGTDEDAIMRQLQQNPDLMNRVPGEPQ
jgi:hypothetical protein